MAHGSWRKVAQGPHFKNIFVVNKDYLRTVPCSKFANAQFQKYGVPDTLRILDFQNVQIWNIILCEHDVAFVLVCF